MDGSVQDCNISIADTQEIPKSCTESLICCNTSVLMKEILQQVRMRGNSDFCPISLASEKFGGMIIQMLGREPSFGLVFQTISMA